MRVALLAHDLTDPCGRGLQRYTAGLAQALSALPEVELFLISRQPAIAEFDHLTAHREVWYGHREILWEQVDLPRRLRRLGIDVLHAPSNRGLPVVAPCATVLTRHDEIDERFPPHGSLRSRFRLRYADAVAVRRAQRVVTVSHTSRADIEGRWRLAPGRVVVCGEGIDDRFFNQVSGEDIDAVRQRWGLRDPYVLYVGGFGGRKDVRTLLDAFCRLERPGLMLALCGSPDGEAEELRRRIADHRAEQRVRITGRIPDGDLPALYAGCELFVYPSRYEGFGLQVIEAMARGAPVLTSDGGSLPEIAGGAGRVFRAGDAAACALAMGELLGDDAARSTMRRAGIEHAQRFRWDRIIESYLHVYREVIGVKILVLLPDSPDPWSNTAARYYGPMLKTLAALGHQVTVCALRRQADQATELAYFNGVPIRFRLFDPPPPRPFWERKLRSLWRSGWELAVSDFGRTARAEAAQDYDVILAEDAATARAVESDPRTVLSLLYLRYVDLAQNDSDADTGLRARLQARRAELSTCRRVRTIRVLSQRLARLLRDEHVRARIAVIPLCIDPALYAPLPPPAMPTVGVLGSMFWPPSRRAARHFVTQLVPRIRAARPDAHFLVGGWRAEHYLGSIARDAGAEVLDSFRDPSAAFARLSVLVCAPPIGTGMKVKVLEAMAYGVPAVVNEEGFEGLEADPNPPVRLAHSDDEIVDQVVQLLSDPQARRRAADEGRGCIERSFSPQVVTSALAALLRDGNGGEHG